MDARMVVRGSLLLCAVFQVIFALIGGILDAFGLVFPSFNVLAAVLTACLVLLSLLAGWISSARPWRRIFGAGLLFGGAMFTRACLAALFGLVLGAPTSASFVLTTLVLGVLGLVLSPELLIGKAAAKQDTNHPRGFSAAD